MLIQDNAGKSGEMRAVKGHLYLCDKCVCVCVCVGWGAGLHGGCLVASESER